MQETERFLARAKELHGDVCFGLALGVRLSLAGMRSLGLSPAERNRRLIAFVEVDRCMTDAVQAVTGCSLGHRNLKYVDYGKFACVLLDTASGRAVRVSTRDFSPKDNSDTIGHLMTAPEDELLKLEEVDVRVNEDDMPGKPKNRAFCAKCGERILDNRGVRKGDKLLCRACANGAYYRVLPGPNLKE